MFLGQWTMISAPFFFQEGLECSVGTWWDHTVTQQAKGNVTCHEMRLRAGSQLHHTPPVAVTSWHEAFGGSGGSVNAACCSMLQSPGAAAPLPHFLSSSSSSRTGRCQGRARLVVQPLGWCLDEQVGGGRGCTSQGCKASRGQNTAPWAARAVLHSAARVLPCPSPGTTQRGGLGKGASHGCAVLAGGRAQPDRGPGSPRPGSWDLRPVRAPRQVPTQASMD